MTTWVLPGEPRPVRLMNTIWADRVGVHEELSSVDALRAWLSDVGLPVAATRTADLTRAVSLRDALRRLAAVATADGRPGAATGLTTEQALMTVNDALRQAPRPRLHLAGKALSYAPPAEVASTQSALAIIAVEAAELLTTPAAPLRACLAPGCVLYYLQDHHRRAWCSLACGNRARAARHYARHRTG